MKWRVERLSPKGISGEKEKNRTEVGSGNARHYKQKIRKEISERR